LCVNTYVSLGTEAAVSAVNVPPTPPPSATITKDAFTGFESLLLRLLWTTGFSGYTLFNLGPWNYSGVKGVGDRVKETHAVSPFTGITVAHLIFRLETK
jgi:hypothetical protein